MDAVDQMVYATIIVIAAATIIGAIYVAVRLRTDRNYRRQFWASLEEERRYRERGF